jgi:hypothetical protein
MLLQYTCRRTRLFKLEEKEAGRDYTKISSHDRCLAADVIMGKSHGIFLLELAYLKLPMMKV